MCHPATVIAAIVLLVNDHLLKPAWPGLVTGKLSDAAGLVVAPPLLALLFLRRADLAATLLTGVLFTLVKTTETGAEAASHVWTLVAGPSRVLADPTDLLALPTLALAWWVRQRSLAAASSGRWRVLLTMPLAVLAVGATSAAPGPPEAQVAVSLDGNLLVSGQWATPNVTTDGGRTWRRWNGEVPRYGQSAACVPKQAQRCYEVVDGRMAVMQSDDGGATWTPSWELSAGRLQLLERAHDRRELVSESLAVQATPRGHVVVVANGIDGVVMRDEAGTWRRLGFDGAGILSAEAAVPLDDGGGQVGGELRAAILLGILVTIAGLAMAARVVGYSTSPWLIPTAALIGVLLATIVPYDGLFLIVAGIGLALTAGMLIAAIVEAKAAEIGAQTGWPALGTGVLVALGIAAPFRGWGSGWPDDYGTALAMAAFFSVSLGAGGLVLVWRNARARSAELDYLAGSSTSRPT